MAIGGLIGGIVGLGLSVIFPGSAALWFSIGATVGGALGAPTPPDVAGPRLENLTITTSGYGRDIPKVYGKAQVGGKYIASTDLIESVRREKISSGGLFGKSQYQTTYHYHIDCAVAFSHGPGKIVKLWADGELIYNADAAVLTQPSPASNFFQLLVWVANMANNAAAGTGNMRVYNGTETQEEDSIVESIVGSGNASGYRGIIYVALKRFELEKFGNRPPNFTALIASEDPNPTGLVQGPDSYAQRNPAGTDNDDWLWKFYLLGTFNDGALPGVFEAIDYQLIWNQSLYSTSATIRSAMSWTPGYVVSGKASIFAVYSEPQKIINSINGRGSVLVFNRWDDTFGSGGKAQATYLNLTRYPLHLDASDLLFRPVVAGGATAMLSPENRPVICQSLSFTNGNRAYGDNLWFIDLNERSGSGKIGNERLIPINTDYASSWTNTSRAEGLAIFGDHLYFTINTRDLIYHNLSTGVQVDTGIANMIANPSGDPPVCAWIDDTHLYYLYSSTTGAGTWHITQIAHGSGTPVKTINIPAPFNTLYGLSPMQIAGNYIYLIRTSTVGSSPRLIRFDFTSEDNPVTAEDLGAMTFDQQTAGRFNLGITEDQSVIRGWDNDANIVTWSRWYGFGNTYDDGVALSSIVSDLCNKSGLSGTDIDVTALASTSVKGYLIDRKMTAKAAIEQLMSVYQFARQQLDGKLVFVDLTDVDEIVVDADDLIMDDNGGRMPFITTPDNELPRAVDLSYLDSEREYEVSTVRALRGSSMAENITSISIPVVLSSNEGAQRSDILLSTAWIQRRTYTGRIPLKYLSALPANVLSLTLDGITHKVLLTSISIGDDIGFQGVGYEAGTLVNGNAVGDSGDGQVVRGIDFSGPTILEFLDINPLQSVDVGPGYYLAVAGVLSSWKGCLVYRSTNNGETYEPFDAFTDSCIIGQTTSVLQSGPVDIFDVTSHVDVRVIAGGTPAAAANELAVLNGANLVVIGDEILQYRDVEDLGNNIYRLSHLLRGKQGTEAERDNHFIGERAVVIQSGGIKFVPTGLSTLASGTRFIATSAGQEFEPEEYEEFTWTARILKPFTVHDVEAYRDSSGNLTVSWIRRVRLNNALQDFTAAPLDEESELYEIDVMDGDEVLATYNSDANSDLFDLDERVTFDYSDAQQTTDSVPDPANIDLRIYQMSADVGRGHELEVTV